MDHFRRYAIYYVPDAAPWADFAAAWLGWDALDGRKLDHPDLPGLPLPVEQVTQTPRRYGLHATIKPPFRLAENATAAALHRATDALCSDLAPVRADRLRIARLGRFLALLSVGEHDPLAELAADVVAGLDAFRAPPDAAELARRRAARLDAEQDRLLLRWGYPNVMQRFRFHITLTGRLSQPHLGAVRTALAERLEPMLPQPFRIASLCLMGEDADGYFHLIHRAELGGRPRQSNDRA